VDSTTAIFLASWPHNLSVEVVEAILVSCNHLKQQHVPKLVEALGRFSALKRLDVSGNPALSCAGAAAIFSALSSMLSAGALFARHISSNC
jgi:hypothetical protein